MARRWVARQFRGPGALDIENVAVAPPRAGQVTIAVRAVGLNPIDLKMLYGQGHANGGFPHLVGSECAGVITAVGSEQRIATGPAHVGDEVVAFRISGALTTMLNVDGGDVFAKPAGLSFSEAANLLLVGVTAADMLRLTVPQPGDTVLVHGASGAVGASLLQQLAAIGGIRVLCTASERRFDIVRSFGGEPVTYGDGLLDRVDAAAPEGIAWAYDCIGTDEAIDASLALAGRERLVTIANSARAQKDGFTFVTTANAASKAFRAQARADLIALASAGSLSVPVARTFDFSAAPSAFDALANRHNGGKLAVLVD